MINFSNKTINDICYNVCSGGTPTRTKEEYYKNGNIPWLTTTEINYNRVYSTKTKITEEGLKNSSAKYIDKDSVIVAMYGRGTAGRVAISKIKLTTNQACCNLSINPKLADYNYVYYYLKNNFYKLDKLANGAVQQNLNTKIIKNFNIKLPSLINQKKISSILFMLDKMIKINSQTNQNINYINPIQNMGVCN